MKNVDESIQELSHRRQELWRSRTPDSAELARVTRQLEDLFADRRAQRAQRGHGSRETIVRRARIESELERLVDLERVRK